MSESALLRSGIQRLWLERRWITIERINCGTITITDYKTRKKRIFRGAKPGTGDLVGYFAPEGRHIELEFKWGKNGQQANQKERETDVKAKGGLYFLIRTPEDLERVIKQIKPANAAGY